MASRDAKDLLPILTVAYYKACDIYKQKYPSDPQPFLTCTHRSNEEQTQLYAQKPKVTNAKAGQSPHNYLPSYAFDIGFITVDKKLSWDKKYFKAFADILYEIEPRIEWGGSWNGFKDISHYQLNGWQNFIKK